MLRRPRASSAGASTALVLAGGWLLCVAGLGAGAVLAVSDAGARAEHAAAAAAHAAEGAVAVVPGASDLSVAVQAARTVCALDDPQAPPSCAPPRAAAAAAARANGAELVSLALGPDPRDRGAEAAPGRFVAVATVELRPHLPLLGRFCAAHHPRPAALCEAGATAAARLGSPPRRLALVDAPEAVRRLRWELDHPRDADRSAGHRLVGLLSGPLGAVTRGAAWLLGIGAGGVSRVLAALGPVGAPLRLGGRLVGASFDGRGLHAALTRLGMVLLTGPMLVPLDRVGAVHEALAPLRAVVSFGVAVLTGVDDSDRVHPAGIVLALACDALLLAKPLAIGARFGIEALIARATPGAAVMSRVLRGTLGAGKHAGDLLSGKPTTLLRLVRIRPRRRVGDVLDTASLLYRPGSAANHLAQLAGRLARWGRTTASAAEGATLSERALAAALARVGHAPLRRVEELAELSQLHSGARTLTAAAGGELHPLGGTAPPPPPPLPRVEGTPWS